MTSAINNDEYIYERYLKTFDEKFGTAGVGESVRNEGYIIKKLQRTEFEAVWAEFQRTEEFLRETMSRGNTLSDAVENQYRELAAQVLEKPKDFKTL